VLEGKVEQLEGMVGTLLQRIEEMMKAVAAGKAELIVEGKQEPVMVIEDKTDTKAEKEIQAVREIKKKAPERKKMRTEEIELKIPNDTVYDQKINGVNKGRITKEEQIKTDEPVQHHHTNYLISGEEKMTTELKKNLPVTGQIYKPISIDAFNNKAENLPAISDKLNIVLRPQPYTNLYITGYKKQKELNELN
jgi:hypothetical protein